MNKEQNERESQSGTYGRSGNNGWSRSSYNFRINLGELHEELCVMRPDETELDSDGTL